MTQIQPVILCGGKGTRLWPLSRDGFPKQFLTLGGELSLLEATLRRLSAAAAPICVTCALHRHLVRAALGRMNQNGQIIVEPVPRNTAPAIAAAALVADPGAILAVMPSDHLVADDMGFNQAIAQAKTAAEAGWICVLGVAPVSPSQAFGYIVPGEGFSDGCRRKKRPVT